jgi:arsenate reductase
MNAKKKILFLCSHNAARSQMAEGFVNARYDDRYEAHSAGNEPTELHPCAITVMAEVGIDIASQRAKSLNEFDDMSFDYVVTLCADNQENCPIFPGGETYLQHAFIDPVPRLEEQNCGGFRRVRDQIKAWLQETFGEVE